MLKIQAEALSSAIKAALSAASDCPARAHKDLIRIRWDKNGLSVHAAGTVATYSATVPISDLMPYTHADWVELSGGLLAEELDAFKGETVRLDMAGKRLTVQAGTLEYRLPIVKNDVRPAEPVQVDGCATITIPSPDLIRLLDVGGCCAGDQIPGTELELVRDAAGWQLCAVSTDGTRMSCAVAKVQVEGADDVRAHEVPAPPEHGLQVAAPAAWIFSLSDAASGLLARMADGQTEVKIRTQIGQGGGRIVVDAGQAQATISQISRAFPDYRWLAGSLRMPFQTQLSAQELRRSVQGAVAPVDAAMVHMKHGDSDIELIATSKTPGPKGEVADAHVRLKVDSGQARGGSMVSLDPKKLGEILAAFGRQTVSVRYGQSDMDPVAVVGEGGWAVLMPMRRD